VLLSCVSLCIFFYITAYSSCGLVCRRGGGEDLCLTANSYLLLIGSFFNQSYTVFMIRICMCVYSGVVYAVTIYVYICIYMRIYICVCVYMCICVCV
jgi:hypothetical protein